MKDSIQVIISSEPMIDQAYRQMKEMLRDHGWFRVEIKRGARTLSQNALYWVWIEKITKYLNEHNGTDFSTDEVHLRMKHDHLGYEPAVKIGSTQIRERLKSTSDLTKGEFFAYMEKLDSQWASLGLMLPRPDGCQYEQLKQRQTA